MKPMNERKRKMHENVGKERMMFVNSVRRLANLVCDCLFRRMSRLDARCDLFRSTRRLDTRGVGSWFPGIK